MLSSPIGANSSMSSLGGSNERHQILRQLERDIRANYKKKEEDLLRAAKKEALELRRKYRETKKRHRQELSNIYTSLLESDSTHRQNIILTTAEINKLSQLMQSNIKTFEAVLEGTEGEGEEKRDGTRDGHPMIRKLRALMDQEATAIAKDAGGQTTGGVVKKGRKSDETVVGDGPH